MAKRYNLTVEVDNDVLNLIQKSIKNKTDLISGWTILDCVSECVSESEQEGETSVVNNDTSNVWPTVSNCIRICRNCMARCLYRKEPYQDKTKQQYGGTWVDMLDKHAVQKMFDAIKI